MNATPSSLSNRFAVLSIENASDFPKQSEDVPNIPSPKEVQKILRPRWERRRLPKAYTVASLTPGEAALYLKVEVQTIDTQEKRLVRALLDSGATGLFIDREYVKSNRLPTRKLSHPIPVYNVDGSPNEAGSISEVVELLLRYDGHSERALFAVTGLGKQKMILGYTWLRDHNPDVDWQTREVRMSRCPHSSNCPGCAQLRKLERKAKAKEDKCIHACRLGPTPEPPEETEQDDDDPTPISDLPFDIEDGDRVWTTGLFPQAEEVRAVSSVSQ